MDKAEIIIYKDVDDTDFQIEVRVEDETVWLTQAQMVNLFAATKQNISLHINNIFREEELQRDSVVKESLTVQSERGTQFRIWANRVLKEYLLRGHLIGYRLTRIEEKVDKIKDRVNELEFRIQTNLPHTEGVFFDGQIFDAWQFVSEIIKKANTSIILIDNYIDESVLLLLAKRKGGTKATIFTGRIDKQLENDLKKYNEQYPAIEVKVFTRSHDRFLIVDNTTIYHIGASLKDLGKKWFAFSRMNLDIKDLLDRMMGN